MKRAERERNGSCRPNRDSQQPARQRLHHGAGARRHLELRVYALEVVARGVLADLEPACDLRVQVETIERAVLEDVCASSIFVAVGTGMPPVRCSRSGGYPLPTPLLLGA